MWTRKEIVMILIWTSMEFYTFKLELQRAFWCESICYVRRLHIQCTNEVSTHCFWYKFIKFLWEKIDIMLWFDLLEIKEMVQWQKLSYFTRPKNVHSWQRANTIHKYVCNSMNSDSKISMYIWLCCLFVYR